MTPPVTRTLSKIDLNKWEGIAEGEQFEEVVEFLNSIFRLILPWICREFIPFIRMSSPDEPLLCNIVVLFYLLIDVDRCGRLTLDESSDVDGAHCAPGHTT